MRLPSLLSIERLGKDLLSSCLDVDAHSARSRCVINAVHFKARIGNVKIDLYRVNRFDRGAATHRASVALDHSSTVSARLHPDSMVKIPTKRQQAPFIRGVIHG